jgi:hypothetical protein
MEVTVWNWRIENFKEFACPSFEGWASVFARGASSCKDGKYQITEWLDLLLKENEAPDSKLFNPVDSYGGLFTGQMHSEVSERRLQVHIKVSSNSAAFLGFMYEEAKQTIYLMGIWCGTDSVTNARFKQAIREELPASGWSVTGEW